jgi:hypothetical protein
MITDNQMLLQAILGTGAQSLGSTLDTGTFNANSNQQGSMNMGQLPQMGSPLDNNQNYMNTIKGFFSGPQSTFGSPMQQPMRHTAGRDSWSSGMGLDHQSILRNIGLGGQ